MVLARAKSVAGKDENVKVGNTGELLLLVEGIGIIEELGVADQKVLAMMEMSNRPMGNTG